MPERMCQLCMGYWPLSVNGFCTSTSIHNFIFFIVTNKSSGNPNLFSQSTDGMLWYSSALNCNRRPVPLIRYAEAGIRLVAAADAAAAKLLQSCPTLGDPTDGSPLGSPISGILQAKTIGHMPSVQFSSVAQLCPTLCNPMNCSTPGLPVHHELLEFTQTHIHQVSDAIQPSHPLSSPSALKLSQHQGLFR